MNARTYRLNPLTSVLLTATLGLGAFGSAQAASTFYVRADGGDASQCTGRGDASYSGSGTAQNCAWKHPYYALPSSGSARIAGGDTLMIAAGEYMIGYGAPGATCTSGDRTGCWLGKVPSGPSATARTRILGKAGTAPKLWGTEGNAIIVNLDGSSNVEIGNLEITDKSQCVVRHGTASAACGTGGTWAQYGIYAYNSKNVWMHDVNIHGMGHTGLSAGKLTDWTIERSKINANGWAGWDSNVGSDGSNSGQMILRDIEVAWNGCGQNPSTGAAVNCWGQVSGGYGDGIGLNTTGGQWLVEDAFIHHNTSDGLDFLYLDGAASTSVIFRRVLSVANSGNQIKSNGNTIIENSVVISQCSYFAGILKDGEVCRASGNALSLTPAANTVITVRHNTITGEGDNLILTREGASSGKVYIQNNALIGQTDYLAAQSGWPDDLTGGHYAYNSSVVPTFSGNLFWNVKAGQCPAGSICQEPKVTNKTMASFDGIPLAGSPLIDKLAMLSGVNTDFLLQPRPSGSATDIGAYEVQSGGTTPPPPPPPPTCTRAKPTVTLTGPTAAVAAGTNIVYTVAVSNMDTAACSNTSFSLARTVPANWTGTLSATSLTLAPGASSNATLSVTSANGSTAGAYGIGAGISSSVGSTHTASAASTYAVKDVESEPAPALTGSVGTNKSSYIGGETVNMSARVLNNGVPVNAAAVKFTTTKPNGITTIVMSTTTDSDGYARRSFVSGTGNSSMGTYTLDAVATSNGKSVTAGTTFSVSKTATSPPPAPTCTRATPTVALTGPTEAVAAGTNIVYTVAVSNMDTAACSNTSFSLARTVPANWTGTLSATSLTLAPGTSSNATLSVTSANGSTAGAYGIGTGVSSSVGSTHTASAASTYTVKDAEPAPVLTGSVGTNKATYIGGETVKMNARVLKDGKPVQGAAVEFMSIKPDGVTTIPLSATTNSRGYARASFVSGTGPSSIGKYQLTAVATFDGDSVSASKTYNVK